MPSNKHEVFIDKYLQTWNATDAYQIAYPKCSRESARRNGSRLLTGEDVSAAIKTRLDEMHMSANEALKLMTDQARAGMSRFFKIQEEWIRWPLPTYEIIGEKEVEEPQEGDKPAKKYIMYWVRHVVLDTDKLLDPEAARLVHKFSSSPKTGLSIELHDQQAALDKILRIHGKYQDNLDLTTNGEPITKELTDTERVARLTAIFDKVRARRDQQLVP